MSSAYPNEFFDHHVAGSLRSARIMLKELFALLPAVSVVDVGCGRCPWLLAAKELGAQRLLGIDGDYVDRTQLLVDPACFSARDLETDDLAVDARFDLAISVEVAEHLPAARAATFVAQLCALTDLVAFSAAVPGQGGVNHVNEQWPDYWAELFARNNFDCFDVLRPRLWNEEECELWYLQNILLFARKGTDVSRRIWSRRGPPSIPLRLIHPRLITTPGWQPPNR